VTDFSNKVKILAKLWIDFRDDEKMQDFIEYNDMGLPLAYLSDNELAKPTDLGNKYIEETFDLLLASLDIEEDTGFESLDELFGTAL
jgi:hypothetical protein